MKRLFIMQKEMVKMILRSIDIENYKGIERLHVEFQEGVNLLIGNNRAGKTSLLKAMAILLSDCFGLINKLGKQLVRETIDEDAYTTTLVIGGAVSHTVPHYPIVIEGTSSLYGEDHTHKIIKKNLSAFQESTNYKISTIMKDSMGGSQYIYAAAMFSACRKRKNDKE